MKLTDEFENINTIFLDTAPIIYFIEAHFQFGPLRIFYDFVTIMLSHRVVMIGRRHKYATNGRGNYCGISY